VSGLALQTDCSGPYMGHIPPDEGHPLYDEWMAASIRFLNIEKKREAIAETDPEFAAVHSEWKAARAAYEQLLAKLT